MIEFTCSGCGRPFTVPDHFAGRQARCKSCGTPVTVPATAVQVAVGAANENADDHSAEESNEQETTASAPPRRIPMRIRRLTADAEQMTAAFSNFPAIRILSTEGTPPEVYQLEYRVKGLDRGKKRDVPIGREQHRVEIRLTSEYPRQSPQCKMLTPIFHPNIDPSHICVGDHWAAGERLVDLVIRIGELIAYQAYNIKSPLDAEAAMWADLHQADLPTDSQTLRPANLV
jgi:ubiquitin-protein ligase/DNA-directed RNA polymerase subunit RPC12/RpoP